MPNSIILLSLALLLAGCGTLAPVSVPVTGDAERGAQLFARGREATPPCLTCHQVVSGQTGFTVGPNLAGIGERAGMQIAGLAAEAYLRQSILEPHNYIVSGYRDIMYPDYSVHLSEPDIHDLIAYLLTL